MKPEWCPQWAWDEAEKAIRLPSPTYHDYAVSVSRALCYAHQRGRREGMEEAAGVCDAEIEQAREFGPHHIPIISGIRQAIRAKAQEVKT